MTTLALLIRQRRALAAGVLAFVVFCVATQRYTMARQGTGHQEHSMVAADSVSTGR